MNRVRFYCGPQDKCGFQKQSPAQDRYIKGISLFVFGGIQFAGTTSPVASNGANLLVLRGI